MTEDQYWEKLSNKFYDEILKKYDIEDIYEFEDEKLSENMADIQARFDGERLFESEIEDLEDLETLIGYLEQDLISYYSK